MVDLEKYDIQGLIVRGYGKLPAAKFILLRVTELAYAKAFLNELSEQVNTAANSPDDFAVNIAFTKHGLSAFGLSQEALKSYPREFLEGMADEYRSFILGDLNESDPAKWTWGGPANPEIHMLLLLYAKDYYILAEKFQEMVAGVNFDRGISIVAIKETYPYLDNREHFGFKDGITQPNVDGFGQDTKYKWEGEPSIKAGEFVLGYQNEYDRLNESPTVPAESDSQNLLQATAHSAAMKDLGRNGTYLVYREIKQEVLAFWKFLEANSKEIPGNKLASAIKLGAKMVGRWPNGAPLALSPDEDDSTKSEEKDFGYWDTDRDGQKCPFGAHVRRTNPRDQLFEQDKSGSIEMIRKHLLLRRGRIFGKPLVDSMKPEDILKLEEDDGQIRGLHFICLAASLSRQFEFVQSIWMKSSKFGGMYNDGDPIAGPRIVDDKYANDEFTCPATPLRNKYRDLPQFTSILGGAYFFLPGIRALKFIANLRTP